MEQHTVILYGQSMLLSLVAASLERSPNLRVMQAANWNEVAAFSSECTPNVLIFDLESTSDSAILPLLHINPNLQLIGLDVETNRAILLEGKENLYLTLERMKEIVEKSLDTKIDT